jgi:UDP-glucose 4-epimerase
MKYAVVGGAGFIGHHITNRLINEGHEVVVIDNFSTGTRENCNPKAIAYEADITTDFLEPFLEGVDVVFLTAAKARVQPSIQDPISFNKTNVEGTLRVLLASHKAGVRRVVYSASSSCYGNTDIFPTPEDAPTNPLSPYGLQKFVGEQYCRMFSQVYGLDTVCLRYFNVYGPGMPLTGAYRTVISIFGEQYKNNKPYTVTNNGEQRRDFTAVEDVVDANIRAAKYSDKLNGESFNIGNGDNCSVNEVVRMFDENAEIDYFRQVLEPKQTLADNDKARRVFGWIPRGDLKFFIQHYKKQLNGDILYIS